MNGQELNAPAVSFATIAAGVATVASYVPDFAGAMASIFGALLAYRLWKNARLEKERKILDIELTKIKISEHNK